MIAICDAFSDRYPDMKTLAASMVGALAIEFRDRGWKGAALLDAEFEKEPGRLLIVVGPGHGELTVKAVSDFLKAKRRAQK